MSELRTPWARLPQPPSAGDAEGPRHWRPFRAWRFFKDLPRVWPYLRPYRLLAVVGVFLSGLGVIVGLLAPWPLAVVIDTVLQDKPLPALLGGVLDGFNETTLLVIAVLGGFIVTALASGLSVIETYVGTKLRQHMTLEFRSDLFQHVQRLSLAYHDRSLTGSLIYNINAQATSAGAITTGIPPLIQSLATVVGMFAIAYRIDPMLALVSLSVVPFTYYSAGFYVRRIEPRVTHVRELEKQSMSILQEALTMLRVIVAFGRERYEYGRFREQAETAVDARLQLTVRQTLFSLGTSTLTAAGTAAVLYLGARNVMAGKLTVGELIVILGYIASIYRPLTTISSSLSTLQNQFIQFRGALETLETEPDIKEPPHGIRVKRARGEVVFENVWFSYDERAEVVRDVSFTARPGERVAIVGPTGAGKSTLVSLIPRFYDPVRGRILLDGADLRTLKLKSLRRQISIVLQEPLLFSGTIADNIRYGRLRATDEDVLAAAAAAGADDFVGRFPEGYETVIGQRGARLSGGERQRISIARAFLKNAPILILDEPTSSVDSRTEELILGALERLMVGRTTFVIAHRLSTIRGADVILVIDDGEIIERGTHEDLVARKGLFSELWEVQTGQRGRKRIASSEAARARVEETT